MILGTWTIDNIDEVLSQGILDKEQVLHINIID